LSNAQSGIGDGLAVYEQAADALKLAGKATGPLEKALIKHTQDLLSTAQRVFNDGYQKLTNVRVKFNLVVPVPPQQNTAPVTIPTTPAPVTTPGGANSGSGAGSKHHKKK